MLRLVGSTPTRDTKLKWRNGRRLDLYKNRSYVMNYDTKCMGVITYNTIQVRILSLILIGLIV